MSNVEILAPAGSLDGLYASFQMGADAVYVGTSRFGARAFAKNPSVDELKEALVYAHMHDKKIYLTVNTLLSDRELENDLFPLIAPLYEAGLDACIVQDLGVLSFFNFVQIGSGYYWTPYIIAIAAAIWIPVFLVITVVSYCKREA